MASLDRSCSLDKGNLRRARSGADLEGMVRISVHHDGVPYDPDSQVLDSVHTLMGHGRHNSQTRSGVSDASDCPGGSYSLGDFSDLSG